MEFEHNGAVMHYERLGESGRPLVLLHGWGCSGETMAPLMRDLSPDHRVMAVDFPGHGKSPEPPEPWEVTEFACLTRALMEKEGFLGADVIAHSFGGRVALYLAAEKPDTFSRLMLTGCAGIPNRPDGRLSARTRAYRALKQDLTYCLSRINAPTLLVWGENDTATPIWMGEKMEKEMADAALIRFEGCSHFAFVEQYARFLAIAREFLKN